MQQLKLYTIIFCAKDMSKNDNPPLPEPSFFEGFRSEGFPTMYPENKTAAHVDVLEAGIILAFVMVGATFLLVLPAWRGLEVRKVINMNYYCI